jgi:hypothetical protein
MMPIERLLPGDSLIDALVADMAAVTPRRPRREAALVAALLAIETLLFVILFDMRPDMPAIMMTPGFWWKSGSLAVVATVAAAAALVSLDPATTVPARVSRLWSIMAGVVVVVLVSGWLRDAVSPSDASLLARLDWREGVDCLKNVALLALPPVVLFGMLMRRGAPVQPRHSAAAGGIAAGAGAAFIFAFHCPHDDPLYIAVWYGGAVLIVAGLARLVLPRLSRW